MEGTIVLEFSKKRTRGKRTRLITREEFDDAARDLERERIRNLTNDEARRETEQITGETVEEQVKKEQSLLDRIFNPK